MKTNQILIFSKLSCVLIILLSMGSCMVPVNLNYESAKMLEKGDFEVQGSGSVYSTPDSEMDVDQVNFGAKFGFGVTEYYNVKLRVEGLFPLVPNEYQENYAFIEFDQKIKLGDVVALSLPVGIYSSQFSGSFQFDPRLYLTFVNTQNFDLTVIPKCHIYGFRREALIPGISLGAGFSSDFNKWSIRPEIGFDRMSLSGGISFSYCFKR